MFSFDSSVGVPRIELGLYAPEAHVLPVYYTPTKPSNDRLDNKPAGATFLYSFWQPSAPFRGADSSTSELEQKQKAP